MSASACTHSTPDYCYLLRLRIHALPVTNRQCQSTERNSKHRPQPANVTHCTGLVFFHESPPGKGCCSLFTALTHWLNWGFTSHHNTAKPLLRPFFRDHPGELVPEENFWTLSCKERLTEADTPTIRLGATPSGLTSAHLHHPPIFYSLDALPAAQPTMSKHWRQLAHSD